MLTDIFFLLVGSLLNAFVGLFSVLDFVVPSQVEDTISYFFGFVFYLQHVFPIDTLLSAFGYFMQFFVLWYGLKIVLWFAGVIPFFNSPAKLPSHK